MSALDSAYSLNATYAGTISAKSVDYTLSQGRLPSRAVIRMLPQDTSLIPRSGALVMVGKNTLTLPVMYVDKSSIRLDESGRVIQLSLIDRRWRWEFATITLNANLPHPTGKVGTNYRVTARALCTALATAMGEGTVDFSAVSNTEYPPVSWFESNAIAELEKLLARYGLEVAFDPFSGTVGAVLPGSGSAPTIPSTDIIYESAGIDLAEGPEYVRVVGEEYRFQCWLSLQAIGYDPDTNTWEEIDDLSYKPAGGWEYESPFDLLPDETDPEIRKAANETVYRVYRVKGFALNGTESGLNIPGWSGTQPTLLEQILPLDQYLLTSAINANGFEQRLRPYVRGIFKSTQNSLEPIEEGNTASSEQLESDFRIDYRLGHLILDYPLYRLGASREVLPAKLWLMASFRLTNATSNIKEYYAYNKATGLTGGYGYDTVKVSDLTPRLVASYVNDDPLGATTVPDTVTALTAAADAIADLKIAGYSDLESYVIAARFLQAATCNGVVRQIRWIMEEGTGSKTYVYLNNDSSMAAMTGPQRRRASGAIDYFQAQLKNQLVSYQGSSEPKG